jgi:uncharacterized protein YeaO (DUF488 family)
MVTIRRVYESEDPGEYYKVLIDRLWPRGISKDKAGWNEWMKEVAPSNELRKWFNHVPDKCEQFKQLYKTELTLRKNDLDKLKQLEIKYGTLTLLYAAKDEKHNNAVVLKELFEGYENK